MPELIVGRVVMGSLQMPSNLEFGILGGCWSAARCPSYHSHLRQIQERHKVRVSLSRLAESISQNRHSSPTLKRR